MHAWFPAPCYPGIEVMVRDWLEQKDAFVRIFFGLSLFSS